MKLLESDPLESDLVVDGPDTPPRPASLHAEDLGFTPRPMVRWLNPRQLVDTSFRVLLSTIFGAYADKRELQAATSPEKIIDRSKDKGIWIDYVADTGDGFNSTYSVASQLAAENLELNLDGSTHHTKRGQVLVMGGDQVYPTAKREEYSNRLLGPYRAALPFTEGPDNPALVAIPGTHDWHDGLTTFMRIFCQERWIGGWKTEQSRSYYAMKLPNGWWLWGIDIQLDSYIDDPQLRYFSRVASEANPGDKIILSTARSPWLRTSRDDDGSYSQRNLDYFERRVLAGSGAKVALYLSSGRHHYCRYEREDGACQRITAGGGGAFLHPTHDLPDELKLIEDGQPAGYRRAAVYPPKAKSKKLRKRLWLLPIRNPAFVAMIGTVHILVALILGLHLGGSHNSLTFQDLAGPLRESPLALFSIAGLLTILTIGMGGLAHETRGRTRLLMGLGHATLQLAAGSAIMIVASEVTSALEVAGTLSTLLFLAILGVLGGMSGALGIAGYFWIMNLLGFHTNEAYGALALKDFKHFLRLHFDEAGALTVYPIGIDRVCRHWKLQSKGPSNDPWFEPEEELNAHLIETPFRIEAAALQQDRNEVSAAAGS